MRYNKVTGYKRNSDWFMPARHPYRRRSDWPVELAYLAATLAIMLLIVVVLATDLVVPLK